jgi:hypothetical protein
MFTLFLLCLLLFGVLVVHRVLPVLDVALWGGEL